MSEVLSQKEIDALLNALNTGEVDVSEMKEETSEKKVRNYDFRNPQKIAKDQLRTLEIIHENFGRLFQTFLSGYLRAPVKMSVLTVDQYAYSEFSNAIANPAFLSIIDFNPLPGEVIIDISTNIAFTIIDRLLGGKGEKTEESRNFTEIEQNLLKNLISKSINLISRAWENVIEINPLLKKIETNPQFAQIVSPNETIALITLSLSIGKVEGMLNFCIPHVVLEPILDKLSTKLWFSSSQRKGNEESVDLIENRLKTAKVLVKAEVGKSILNVKEILELAQGDVIELDNFAGNNARIKIGSNLKFFCEPGSIGNNVAVKITSVKREGDEVDE
ncbi:flagellar motor switch protein FliM [Clostridium sp. D2Q-11]|uniref:Flagellar motor switch protein FliM n=1 Tax=Anaeromonas frigoriresistens TaxID=2683708 RepID=A0A942ZAK3_9FIRM|nr:flagellar motor switch protein FliM [Anaeromonas frigoriresistens]MBS4539855.1 flagellar motor switch protein FliM [Anaeromonas frigoriresistens]